MEITLATSSPEKLRALQIGFVVLSIVALLALVLWDRLPHYRSGDVLS